MEDGKLQPLSLKIALLDQTGKVPTRSSASAAGYDLYAPTSGEVPARRRSLIYLRFKMILSEGYCAMIASRSGWFLNQGIEAFPGVIDADYRGEVGVILINHSDVDFKYAANTRIAQMIIRRVFTPSIEIVEKIEFERREGDLSDRSIGFGSSGK